MERGRRRGQRGGLCRRDRAGAAPVVRRRHLDQRRHRSCRARCFRAARFAPSRRVIDVSGDGSNNRGRPVTLARDEAVAAGIGINGLPILALEPDLDRYYYDSVIGGPGAFVVAAQSYETFADAILKKLITEIAANTPPAHDPALARKR